MPLALSTGLALPTVIGDSPTDSDSPTDNDPFDSPFNAYPLLVGLVGFWNLNEEGGTRFDSHTGGYHLTSNNNPLAGDGVGAGQRAADFVAANQQSLSRPMEGGLLLAAPWECFFWFNNPGDPAAASAIIDCYHNNSPADIGGWRLQLATSSRAQMTWQKTDNTSVSTTQSAAADLTTPGWYSIRVGHDVTQGFCEVNNNGTLNATAGDFKTLTSGKDFEIGRFNIASDVWISGRVQAMGLWARSLTTAEQSFLHNSGTAAILYDDLAGFSG